MKTSRIILPIIALFAYSNILIAQVGIGTTDPQATLHVAGTLQVDDTNPGSAVKLTGIDASGVISEISFGSNINLTAGVLSTSGGSGDHTKETIALIDETFNDDEDDFDWDLDLGGANDDVTVFIIRRGGGDDKLNVNSILGGTEGRRIRIINDSNKDIEFFEDDTNGSSGNNIYIYNSTGKLKKYGSCLLIYSTDVSEVTDPITPGHWCLVQLNSDN